METNGTAVVCQNEHVRIWTGKRPDWFDVFDPAGVKFFGEVYATPCGSFAAMPAGASVPAFFPTFFDAVEAL